MAEEEVQALKANLSALQKTLGNLGKNLIEKVNKQAESIPVISDAVEKLSSLIGLKEPPKINIKSAESVIDGLQDITDKTLDIVAEQLKSINIQDGFLFKKADIISSVHNVVSKVREMISPEDFEQISPTDNE